MVKFKNWKKGMMGSIIVYSNFHSGEEVRIKNSWKDNGEVVWVIENRNMKRILSESKTKNEAIDKAIKYISKRDN